jgi:hypothetical protein
METIIHDGGKIGDGFADERLDCAVRAYAIAKEIPYSDSHSLFKKAGRESKQTTGFDVYDKMGFKFTFSYVTIKQFILDHPKGSFYTCKKGHAFAIKNGVVFDDTKLNGRTVIRKWFEVK